MNDDMINYMVNNLAKMEVSHTHQKKAQRELLSRLEQDKNSRLGDN